MPCDLGVSTEWLVETVFSPALCECQTLLAPGLQESLRRMFCTLLNAGEPLQTPGALCSSLLIGPLPFDLLLPWFPWTQLHFLSSGTMLASASVYFLCAVSLSCGSCKALLVSCVLGITVLHCLVSRVLKNIT